MPDTKKELPLEERVFSRTNRMLHQSDFPVKIVKQRAVEAMIIFRGLAADRPDGSSEVLSYFATDSGVLSIWSGSAWLDVTLS
ncbi:MAG TPA: hypothetical protein ENI23_09605 [bacterium]|nr:hypothetical protein [bacterium]